MDPILETIDEALKRKGLSDAAASKLAVGHSSLIKNLRMPREGEKRYNLPALMKLAEVLDLEFYFGPIRDSEPARVALIDGAEYAAIPRFEAELAAGAGQTNDQDVVIETFAFRRDWLKRIPVSPSNACLVKVRGDSMEPLLHDQDMVLIDRSRRTVRPGKVYALTDGGAARVKRLERPDDDTLVLRSDNPSYPLEFRRGSGLEEISILGQVVWSGHTF